MRYFATIVKNEKGKFRVDLWDFINDFSAEYAETVGAKEYDSCGEAITAAQEFVKDHRSNTGFDWTKLDLADPAERYFYVFDYTDEIEIPDIIWIYSQKKDPKKYSTIESENFSRYDIIDPLKAAAAYAIQQIQPYLSDNRRIEVLKKPLREQIEFACRVLTDASKDLRYGVVYNTDFYESEIHRNDRVYFTK